MLSHTFAARCVETKSNAPLFNADNTIENYLKMDGLNLLFKQAMKQIEDLVAEGIDSKRVTTDLERLLANKICTAACFGSF